MDRSPRPPATLTCVDRGGTFTDVVRIERTSSGDRVIEIEKIPSDCAVIGDLGADHLRFGTTVATNALLEGRGAPTLLLVSEGFGDLLALRDQRRPALFEPDATETALRPLRVLEVVGRLDATGRERVPLSLPALAPSDLVGFEAAAVVLMHATVNPAHEDAVAAHLAAIAPHLTVVRGHVAAPTRGYLARVETALVDAALTPVLSRSFVRDRIPPAALALRSDGTLAPADALRAQHAVLSGPAGGVLATMAIARAAGFSRAIGFDMGGTSTDVCCVDGTVLPLREGDLEVAGVRLRTRMLAVETIAAGGGSILASDGIRLSVGPGSAGADPGPQCYGRGGPPTLTDAAVASGLLDVSAFPLPLDPAAIQLPGPAEDFLKIAHEAMAFAIRRVTTQRGLDPADHVLVAFGGAGPQHAASVASLLGIRTVLVHATAPVQCAFGASLAPVGAARVAELWCPLDAVRDELVARAEALALGVDAPIVTVYLRETGSDHALPVPLSPGRDLEAAFDDVFASRYGFSRADRGAVPLEVERLEVVPAVLEGPIPEVAVPPPAALVHGEVIGPHTIAMRGTTVVVPRGWRADWQGGAVVLTALDDAASKDAAPRDTTRTPLGVELWQNRFLAAATEAGVLLARLAHSVNIRERHDFSCAIFDGEGRLVVNAPHVPVHLGAMGETVRDVLRHAPDVEDGAAFLTNAPSAGGSHLPDLTVVTAVVHDGHRFFVASRAHHADVGGATPGSMPPHSTRLSDEGLVFIREPVAAPGGRALHGTAAFRARLQGSRQPAMLVADLEAQLAANASMARALRALGAGATLAAWMEHLRAAAREAAIACLERLRGGRAADRLGGVPLRLALTLLNDDHGPRLRVDLAGTGGPHPGNLNAPPGVVRAAVLYALRVLIGRPIPLNDGVLEVVEILTPSPSIVAPPPEAAVVGGNVETSQRLVDLFFMACEARAASQGTMNNLVLGGDGWSIYETLGGGLGAAYGHGGRSARQVHMTNTRITDPEILETRLPLTLLSFGLRVDSGGAGRWRGGDGLVRELRVEAPATATLLAAWREGGAPGLAGGMPGAPGRAFIDGAPWDGAARKVRPGAVIRVETPGGGGYGSPTTSSREKKE